MSFLGKLSIEAVPYHEPIVMVTLGVVAVLGLVIAGLITKYKAKCEADQKRKKRRRKVE